MTILHRLASVLRWALRRDRAERDLNDELRAFVDMAAADRMRDGVAPDEARRLAVLQLGGIEQAKERIRTGRHGARLDEVGRDVRHGLRQIRRNPVFSSPMRSIPATVAPYGVAGSAVKWSPGSLLGRHQRRRKRSCVRSRQNCGRRTRNGFFHRHGGRTARSCSCRSGLSVTSVLVFS